MFCDYAVELLCGFLCSYSMDYILHVDFVLRVSVLCKNEKENG